LGQVAQVYLQGQQTVETEITLYFQQLLLLAVVVDSVMLLPRVEVPPLAVQAVVVAHRMVLVALERLIKDMRVVTPLVVANSITLRGVAVVRAQLEKLL
jgi:hypothetical protein